MTQTSAPTRTVQGSKADLERWLTGAYQRGEIELPPQQLRALAAGRWQIIVRTRPGAPPPRPAPTGPGRPGPDRPDTTRPRPAMTARLDRRLAAVVTLAAMVALGGYIAGQAALDGGLDAVGTPIAVLLAAATLAAIGAAAVSRGLPGQAGDGAGQRAGRIATRYGLLLVTSTALGTWWVSWQGDVPLAGAVPAGVVAGLAITTAVVIALRPSQTSQSSST